MSSYIIVGTKDLDEGMIVVVAWTGRLPSRANWRKGWPLLVVLEEVMFWSPCHFVTGTPVLGLPRDLPVNLIIVLSKFHVHCCEIRTL